MDSIVIILIAIIIILMILGYKVSCQPHPISQSIISSFLNILVLICLSIYTNLNLPINYLSLGLAAITGLPGISTIIILNSMN